MLLLEAMSHTLYFSSITRYSLWQQYGAQLQLTAVDMGITSFWVLMFMWLKVSCSSTAALTAQLYQFYEALHLLMHQKQICQCCGVICDFACMDYT